MDEKFFPNKMFSFCDGVDITDEKINEWIQECIANSKSNKDYFGWNKSSGNTRVEVFKYDNGHEVYVSKGYYRGFVEDKEVNNENY